MNVKVYNDGVEVFEGSLVEFLADNENEEWLAEECAKLESADCVEFSEISGQWKVIKQ